MNLKTNIPILFFCLMSFMGIAQIKKHSFGAGFSNGFIYNPEIYSTFSSTGEERLLMESSMPYAFGVQGSFLNVYNKWLAWKTSLNLGSTANFAQHKIPFDGSEAPTNKNRRIFWGDIGFGPIFTYQKKDYGFYAGGSLDISLSGSVTTGPPYLTTSSRRVWFNLYPYIIPAMRCGYWQRIGNVNSPWFLEIELVQRDIIHTHNNLFSNYRNNIHRLHALTIGFRYEIQD